MSVEQPTNLIPEPGATNVPTSPFLQASAFVTASVQPGEVAPDWRISLALSRDGVVWGPDIYRPYGEQGRYATRVQWAGPGGLGQFESFMGIRLRTNAPIEFSLDALWLDADV
jgi:hypothetical protein